MITYRASFAGRRGRQLAKGGSMQTQLTPSPNPLGPRVAHFRRCA